MMAPGTLFCHRLLGECRLDRINSDGSVTVTSTHVHGDTNVFRLVRPENPSYWEVKSYDSLKKEER